MKLKLVGITNDCFESKKVIMRSNNLKVLRNMREVLKAFGDYKELVITTK